MLEIKNLYKTYKPKKGISTFALNDISIALPNKGLIFLVGKSGSGKSTLLNIIGGLDKPDRGEIIINGKSLDDFRNYEFDAFRNTYLGFVFQDFNLLDEYNVCQNIELALNLQKKKLSKIELEQFYKKVGIEGLEKRKINELSGGQKQRVAIARALVKNPTIILADEPTGNLDSETSNQIFQLLKNISQNKLVVVVSHDLEYAKKYGDRIIELSDGKVISDSIITLSTEEKIDFKLIKSRLPFFQSLKMAFMNLKRKKIRLFFTILLITTALSFFGFATTLTYFNIPKTHAETMVTEKTTLVEINKKIEGENFTSASPIITFTETEISEVEKKLNQDIIKVSKAVENNSYLSLEFPTSTNLNQNTKLSAYYGLSYFDNIHFLEYNDTNLEQLDIIGNVPKNSHEVLIHKVLADYLIHYGISIYSLDEKGNQITESFFPKNYDDLLNSKKKIVFGTSYLQISGVINDDMSRYEELKNTLYEEVDINPSKVYEEFKTKYQKVLYEMIVNNSFFTTLDLNSNNSLSTDFYKTIYIFNNKNIYTQGSTNIVDDTLKIYDGLNYKTINQLNDNEIIISPNFLDEMFDYEYSNLLNTYLQSEKSKYDQLVKERDEKIEQQQEQLLETPDLEIVNIPEIKPFDPLTLQKEFLIKYINDKHIIGKTVDFQIKDSYLRTQIHEETEYKNLVIIGIDLNGVTNYLSDNIIKNYMRDNHETMYICFNESNVDKLEDVFISFPQNNSKYVSKTIYSDTIINIEKIVNKVEKIAYYASIGFLVFSVILFMNLIIVSINSNKKKIGILRSLGTKKKDIFKIFFTESFLVGLFSFCISSIICYIAVNYANILISNDLFFNIKPVIFRTETIIYLLVVVVVIVIISSIIPLVKIMMLKPIDAIHEK